MLPNSVIFIFQCMYKSYADKVIMSLRSYINFVLSCELILLTTKIKNFAELFNSSVVICRVNVN